MQYRPRKIILNMFIVSMTLTSCSNKTNTKSFSSDLSMHDQAPPITQPEKGGPVVPYDPRYPIPPLFDEPKQNREGRKRIRMEDPPQPGTTDFAVVGYVQRANDYVVTPMPPNYIEDHKTLTKDEIKRLNELRQEMASGKMHLGADDEYQIYIETRRYREIVERQEKTNRDKQEKEREESEKRRKESEQNAANAAEKAKKEEAEANARIKRMKSAEDEGFKEAEAENIKKNLEEADRQNKISEGYKLRAEQEAKAQEVREKIRGVMHEVAIENNTVAIPTSSYRRPKNEVVPEPSAGATNSGFKSDAHANGAIDVTVESSTITADGKLATLHEIAQKSSVILGAGYKSIVEEVFAKNVGGDIFRSQTDTLYINGEKIKTSSKEKATADGTHVHTQPVLDTWRKKLNAYP